MNEIAKKENISLSDENMRVVAITIKELMMPVMKSIGEMLEHNTQAMDQIAALQQTTNDRIEALERQVRLNTPVSEKQVKYINDAIRAKARELLAKFGYEDDKKAVVKLGNAIRKCVLARYGVGGLREIPRHEYAVTMHMIEIWSDMLTLRDVAREARRREEATLEPAQQYTSAHGSSPDVGEDN